MERKKKRKPKKKTRKSSLKYTPPHPRLGIWIKKKKQKLIQPTSQLLRNLNKLLQRPHGLHACAELHASLPRMDILDENRL